MDKISIKMSCPLPNKVVITIEGERGYKPTVQQVLDCIAEYFVAMGIYEIDASKQKEMAH